MTDVISYFNKLNRTQQVGAGILLAVILLGVLQPLVHDVPAQQTDLYNALHGPSWVEPFGTDHLGRSMFSRIGAAIRLSMSLALISVFTAVVPGLIFGVIAGWKGGLTDKAISFAADVVAALPGLMLIMLIATISPGSFLVLYVGISLVLWLEYFRVVRAQTRVLSASPHLESSRLLGFGTWYCFRKHIWPGLASSILPLAALGAGNAILALAALGFVNVGVRPPVSELGLMMTELFPYIYDAPFILMQPILIVVALVLGLNLLTRSDTSWK
ncbi:ABC transporter permease [Halodesulfovibrio aestuarii]|uniref:Peptide/nickel transport system permease protein n=1 Tax=Halodesulfovibrio aestuarii TaxID=126333 RepID=A0A8G2C8L5_9BACT|nr:ABC transporter permease [Halodesulfovibrio aestuarii]SHI83747.1 peptide/nickel transport system permease protein [Halodesulfovibrio aestuarii]